MTATLKHMYENFIMDEIINDILKLKPELRQIFDNAPADKKRRLILNFMEENNVEHRSMCLAINKIVEQNKTGETQHIAGVVKMLREYVHVSAVEVKTMGEVMTPIELVEEMLDTLPYEVWTNPLLKWLDPCNGVGTFLSVVVKRLMKGLETFEPIAELRYKHIIENMIYSCELQAKNVFLYLYAFDPKDEYDLNVFCGSYLSEEFNKHMAFWGVEKFDVIVMNPPYNDSNPNHGSAHTLWDMFVIKTINQLIEGGYLVAVHPDGWRNLGKGFDKVKNVLKSKQMTYLELHNDVDGQKTFGAQTAFDYYCLRNVPNTMFTKIKFQDESIERADISKMEFIPNGMYKSYQKLIAKPNEEEIKILYDCNYHIQKEYVSDVQTEEFKYPCVYSILKDGTMNLKYSNINSKGHFGIPKVIWSNGGASMPIVDINGDYGMTQFGFAIIDEPKNLPLIQKAMLHPDFIKMMKYSNGTKQRYNYKVIALFRKDFWKEFLY